MLGTLTALFSEKAAEKGLEFIIDIAADVPGKLIGDPLRIGQILFNFCSNALKFTDSGEICVRGRVRERTDTGLLLYFEVADTGIGLTAKQQERLFESFRQADMSTTRRYGGTGLGLVISKRLSELMGGRVGVESEFGKGSTFWFTVRIGIGEEQPPVMALGQELRGSRILIVDDNKSCRFAVRTMLESMGFSPAESPSVRQALRMAREEARKGSPFRLVLLDWAMKGSGVSETVGRLTKSGQPGTQVIIMAAAPDHHEVLAAMDAGAMDVLIKPVTTSTVYEAALRAFQPGRPVPVVRDALTSDYEGKLELIAGARVLLVEDNEINQEVAAGLLTEAGLAVDTADNGRIALEMLRLQDYELVLMDMQMPVMDGVSATIVIRKNPAWLGLPIVAMTANATGEDRRACIEAGMVDFIAKPFDPSLLWKVLLKWIRPRAARSGTNREARSAENSCGLPGQLAGIDIKLGLSRVLGKEKQYLSLLRKFLAGNRDTAAKLRAALDSGDRETARLLAHTIKGAAGNIGAAQVQACAAVLEQALKKPLGMKKIMRLAGEFDAALGIVLSELESKLPVEKKKSPDIMDRAGVSDICAKLVVLLGDYDVEAVDVLENNADHLSAIFPAEFPAIGEAARKFDFKAARDALDTAMSRAGLLQTIEN